MAQELHADLVLLDDLEAREEAERLALAVMGTLQVLERVDVACSTLLPPSRSWRRPLSMPAQLVQDMLARDAARKKTDVARMQTQSGMLALQGEDGKYQSSAIYRAYLSRRAVGLK